MFKKAAFFGLVITLCHFGITAFTSGDFAKAAMNSFLQLSALGGFVLICKGKFVEIKEENTEASKVRKYCTYS